MDYKELISKIKPSLERTLEYLKNELMGLQVGRATPRLVEDLEVECYNQFLPIKQLAAIQVPEPRVIVIRPWDKNIIKDIERAISNSRLGLTPAVDEDTVRLNIPPLSEERRRELVKILQDKAEECRISVRRQREDIWKEIQALEREGKIPEDDKFRAKDKLQELIDEYNKKIDEAAQRKREEIMKV